MTFQCQLCEATSAGRMVKRAKSCKSLCDYCEASLARTGRGFCRTCHATPPLAEMRDAERYCAACLSKRNQAKYQRDRDARLAYWQAYRATHKAEIAERNAAYYQAHKEHIKARLRARGAAQRRVWHERHKAAEQERKRVGRRSWPSHTPEHQRLIRVRRKLAILRGWR
jgi:hypothetical protein